MYKPKYLQLWTAADPSGWGDDNYAGHRPTDCYAVLGRHRDSDILGNSNWDAALKELIPNGERRRCYVHHTGHWAVGWVEMLLVHRSAAGTLKLADKLRERLESYPVLDEDDYSDRLDADAQDTWKNCFSLAERVELCREAGVSIFAARHGHIPEDDSGAIFDRCRGG